MDGTISSPWNTLPKKACVLLQNWGIKLKSFIKNLHNVHKDIWNYRNNYVHGKTFQEL
jgi:hypothetical protein